MKLETSRFGVLELPPERLYHFPEGIPGLPGKSWALYAPPGASGYAWLLSFIGLFLLVPSFVALGLAILRLVLLTEMPAA